MYQYRVTEYDCIAGRVVRAAVFATLLEALAVRKTWLTSTRNLVGVYQI